MAEPATLRLIASSPVWQRQHLLMAAKRLSSNGRSIDPKRTFIFSQPVFYCTELEIVARTCAVVPT
jgi:hypothetical protein